MGPAAPGFEGRYAAGVLRGLGERGRVVVPRWWRARSVVVRDGAVGVALAALAFVPPLAANGTRLGELPHRAVDGLAVLAALAQTVPLAWRRRWPSAVLAVAAGGFAVQELRGYPTFAGAGLLVALYSAAAYQERLRGLTTGIACAGYAGLAVALHAAGSPTRVQDFVLFFLIVMAAVAAGSRVRRMRIMEPERRRAAAAAARAGERARIARELHDVITHHVTAMVVQADAAQFLTAAPQKVSANLEAISGTGRRALRELRDLLGVLDPDRVAPRGDLPTLAALPELVVQTRSAGQPVELVEDGRAGGLGSGRELTAYRVVQEALTNALKYAPGRPTRVHLAHRGDGVHIAVGNDPGPAPAHPVGGSGRGLDGLRERVEILGGELHAGPTDDGGFLVTARIPTGDTA
ncbi:histidine kinase [Dactylosporangium matsuzakiense]|uniref:histidine kinase n=1 Tax=Dactylosporangium matsuzakiense TaxID=53360 RepID=A0A9W6KTE6_9ACTN|nr:two-component sensor histidine kinase [Dactylosporangium matsuzakiense]GLL05169.1 two-component sensor histidine kinase [Dactylosporangium matsuzakiense]